jgi:hypothetical protein
MILILQALFELAAISRGIQSFRKRYRHIS